MSTMGGLSEREVQASRREYGENRLSRHRRRSFWRQLLGNFGDPIIKILLVALGINLVVLFRTCNWFESAGIALAVLVATLVSTLSEYGSEAAFERLQEEASGVRCRVRRGGREIAVPAEEVVVGDLVLLQSGEAVPADGYLIDGAVRVDQSSLNGESREAEKHPDDTEGALTPNAVNALLRGSAVCSGEGILRIAAVGDGTVYGHLAGEVQEEKRESPLKLRLEQLAGTLSRLGFASALLVALADLFRAFVLENHFDRAAMAASFAVPHLWLGNLLHALTLAVTVVVVAVPEGLPMMITVVLSSNMRRMLRRQVLVRKLVGIETSGSMNLLFTDKTGTLTVGRPEVESVADAEGHRYRRREELYRHVLWPWLCLSGYYNTDCRISGRELLGGNGTDRALLSWIRGARPLPLGRHVRNRLTFNSERKWSAAELAEPEYTADGMAIHSYYKGAPDRLLAHCTRYIAPDGTVKPLDTATVRAMLTQQASDGTRMLCVALSPKPLCTSPADLIFAALIGLRDEVRPEARRAVKTLLRAGIQTVMVTGDAPETAAAIGRAVGVLSVDPAPDAVLTGEQLAAMSDEEIERRLPHLRIVARALPSDKSRLVRIAQHSGRVVGMTGDGVNDAPALKKADVGFAMGSGTEVAKLAADIVILDDNVASVVQAVLFGRTIFKSIRKFLIFQLTINLCAVAVSVFGPLIGVDTPVTVMQMLWINLIMDTLAGLAFAGEPPLDEYMDEPPKARSEPVLTRSMLGQILCTGGFTAALCLAFLRGDGFKTAFRYDTKPIYWLTAFFALFIFCGIFNSFNARTPRIYLLSHLSGNPAFTAIISLIAIVQLGLIYYGGVLFRTAPLTAGELGRIVLLASLVIPFDLLRKCLFRLIGKQTRV